jgi:hypothetical protein
MYTKFKLKMYSYLKKTKKQKKTKMGLQGKTKNDGRINSFVLKSVLKL